MNIVMNAHAAEDATVREARQRRKNRNTLVLVAAIVAVLSVMGYLYGGYLIKHPPKSAKVH